MNIQTQHQPFIAAFLELEKIAYTHSNQGTRIREFLLSFHDNRKVDTFGFVNLDQKLQRYVLFLIESHINSPHCVSLIFKNRLSELSRFEDM
jgi:hypothetical protein